MLEVPLLEVEVFTTTLLETGTLALVEVQETLQEVAVQGGHHLQEGLVVLAAAEDHLVVLAVAVLEVVAVEEEDNKTDISTPCYL